jgi:hypothetical protein
MVEMAGKAHIQICRDILYVLNRSEDLQNESKISLDSQKQAEYLVRSKRPYQKLKR